MQESVGADRGFFAQKKAKGARGFLPLSTFKKYYAATCDQDDLISIGTVGLIKGISSYRPEKGVRLATYASRCVENEILMHIRKIANQKGEISLDEPINTDWDGNELLLSDVLGTDGDTVLRALEDSVDHELLRAALGRLPARDREIIALRFGLGGLKARTQKEVADRLGISQSYISRLEKRILERLREDLTHAWSA